MHSELELLHRPQGVCPSHFRCLPRCKRVAVRVSSWALLVLDMKLDEQLDEQRRHGNLTATGTSCTEECLIFFLEAKKEL